MRILRISTESILGFLLAAGGGEREGTIVNVIGTDIGVLIVLLRADKIFQEGGVVGVQSGFNL